jgi:hypothetical protein
VWIVVKVLKEGTPKWVTILTIALAAWGVSNGCNANRIANQSAATAETANHIANQSLTIAREVHQAKDIPRLVAHPLDARFYVPTNPEAPGQVKIDMGAIIENLSETDARHVSINFGTLDWYDHRTSLYEIYKERKHPCPIILSMPKGSRFVYPPYAPDAPSSGESGYVNQDKPFKLKLSVYWKDINEKEYVRVGVYDLKAASRPDGKNRLYFQPIETFDSVKDGE